IWSFGLPCAQAVRMAGAARAAPLTKLRRLVICTMRSPSDRVFRGSGAPRPTHKHVPPVYRGAAGRGWLRIACTHRFDAETTSPNAVSGPTLAQGGDRVAGAPRE